MKTKLLFALLFISALGYSQTYSSGPYYISELITTVSGTDQGKEYLEFRGPASGSFPANIYFIGIEGDGSSNPGEVKDVIDLSSQSFGTNGFLGLATVASGYATATGIDPDGNMVDENDVPTYDGDFMDQSITYMLILSATDPDGVDIDTDDDGVIDASGDHTSWTIYDSTSNLDDEDSSGISIGYGQINFAQNVATPGNDGPYTYLFDPIATQTISLNDSGTSESRIYYIARQGVSTGYDGASDWMGGQTNSSSVVPNWDFSGTDSKSSPDELAGSQLPSSNIGGPNVDPVDDSNNVVLSVGDDVLAASLSVYPNPAKTTITIKSADHIQFDSVELYNILGLRVLTTTNLVNDSIDVSEMASGVYLLRINSGNNSATKRVVIE
ncbi:T9SS type A sorting domain-containing protein [Winogradskyella flava]|uniref:T9SS type A sorting domain-containing protein n=1 Tax=Winogradskyella flava TaxID=1884876 RepID=A0A842IMH0_9FLAO|nr:T9SS type A sorting domain-containing protein [Winogradskyella flava]MBC2844150.1 T9SS type A sorting domain-containing protein [Winogradskyella flava]